MAKRQFKILIDGGCPLCKREAKFLRWLDGGRGFLLIADITAPDFDPSKYGKTLDELMGQIHGVTPRGTVLTGMAVFRQAYDAVGWGWLIAPTNWPVLRQVSDRVYIWFARNRLRLTGRRDACDSKRCSVQPERLICPNCSQQLTTPSHTSEVQCGFCLTRIRIESNVPRVRDYEQDMLKSEGDWENEGGYSFL